MTLHSRQKRFNEEVRTHLAEIIRDELRDPRLHVGLCTITSVEASPDLAHATVHVSVLATEKDGKIAVDVLNKSAGYVRRLLGARMVVRHVPDLHFRFDTGARHATRIQELLLKAEAQSSSKPEEPAPTDAVSGDAPSEETDQ